MIEKGHAALQGSGHAHLILLHQKLDEIGLDIGVQKPMQQLARGMVPVRHGTSIRVAYTPFRLWRQQLVLLGRSERGIEIVKIEGRPGDRKSTRLNSSHL